jgi:CheY-like chemotaxis protein
VVQRLIRRVDKIDQAFSHVETVHARLGDALEFTTEGLAKRKRDHVKLDNVKREWSEIKARIAQLSPDAVILDVLLPRVDGWAFLTQVKADPTTRDVPVLIASIIDQKGKGFALGAADYLVKPIQKGELLRTLGTFSLTSKVRTAPVNILVIDDDPKAVDHVACLFDVRDAYRQLVAHLRTHFHESFPRLDQ